MPVGESRPLLKAKLLVPSVPLAVVLRPRLHDMLPGAGSARLTTVVAAAGWGKTTLLASWARSPEWSGRVGWVSLDEADDEPVRFWTYVLSALDSVAPHLTRESLATLSAPGMDPVGVALSAFLNALTSSEEVYALVLDDYHVLREPLIHQSLEFLLAYLPPSLRLVIASRMDPPLPMARMRARGELEEIRVADLRCTGGEGAQLLAGGSNASTDVSAPTGERLIERTEGWPAGLHLTALALRRSGDPDALVTTTGEDHRHVLDYFAAEVLPSLGPEQRNLLVRSSVLERLSGPLCDSAVEITGSDVMLQELDRDGVFISALGAGWYRCHRLFREVLRRELDAQMPDEGKVVLSRAADWFLAQGQVEEAIAHIQDADEHATAVELLISHERWFLDRGAAAAFLRLGERSAGPGADPRLSVTLAVAAGECGKEDRCAEWLKAAEPGISADSDPLPGWRSLRAQADTIWATFTAAGDAEAALRFAARAVDLEDDPSLRGHVLSRQVMGGALLGAGRMQEGIELLQEAWHSPTRRELPAQLVLQAAGQLALVLVESGDLEGATAIAREVEDLATAAEQAWGHGAAAALAGLRLAEARILLAGNPRSAIPALQRAVELAEGWGWATVVVESSTDLAEALWAAGDRTNARVALARAHEAAATGEARPSSVRRAEKLEVRLGRGAVSTARAHGDLIEELTERELSILRALRGPLSAREIGAEMYLSINTVKGYTKSLYRKLDVVTRADAVRRGHDLGLI